MKRKIGCFGRSHLLDAVARAGFDSIELDICELVAMSEAAFSDFRQRAKATGLGLEAYSGFMPLTERLHEPGFDTAGWLEHAKRAAERTAQLGATLWPFGGGKCRSIPAGGKRGECESRFADFLGAICDILLPYNIQMAVEPLGPDYSNYLNLIGETAAFAMVVGRPNCRVMVDMRHMVGGGERWQDIVTFRESILHAHIDYPHGPARRFPHAGDGYDYRPYLDALDRAGYSGLLTVEATDWDDFHTEATACLRLLSDLGAC